MLAHSGAELDPQMLYTYEEAAHFRCYPYERNASISANAHVLSALHYCDPRGRRARVEKILGFFAATRSPGGYWFDKWHVSPYYATHLVIMAASDFAPALVQRAIDWILHTQDESGGWGYYAPTLEETAYALLALALWRRAGHAVSPAVIARGVDYLEERYAPGSVDYPPLWIGKSLYVPLIVAEAGVVSALLACEAAD